MLKPGDAPEAEFAVDAGAEVTAREHLQPARALKA